MNFQGNPTVEKQVAYFETLCSDLIDYTGSWFYKLNDVKILGPLILKSENLQELICQPGFHWNFKGSRSSYTITDDDLINPCHDYYSRAMISTSIWRCIDAFISHYISLIDFPEEFKVRWYDNQTVTLHFIGLVKAEYYFTEDNVCFRLSISENCFYSFVNDLINNC